MDGTIERPSDLSPTPRPAARVQLTGELDLAAFERTRNLLVQADAGAGVIVDLSAVTFIDSSGLRALIEARNQVELTLSGVPESVQRVLEITGLHDYFARS